MVDEQTRQKKHAMYMMILSPCRGRKDLATYMERCLISARYFKQGDESPGEVVVIYPSLTYPKLM